jgi:hypothetical protein
MLLLILFSTSQRPLLLTAAACGLGVLLVLRSLDRELHDEREARDAAVRAASQADRIAQLSTALGRARTSPQIVESSVQEALHAMRADAAMLLLVGTERRAATIIRAVAYDAPQATERTQVSLVARSPISDAVQRGVPVLLGSDDSWRSEYPSVTADIRLSGYEAAAFVPLSIRRRVPAVIRLDFREARSFNADDEAFMSILASNAADILDRVRRHELAQRARAQAETLRQRADDQLIERRRTEQALRASETRYRALAGRTARMRDLTAALSEAVTVQAVAVAVTQHGRMLVGARTADVALLSQDGASFETLNAREPRIVPAEPGWCATEAVQTQRPVLVSSWTAWQQQYWRAASVAADAGHMSSATLPLMVEGRAIGVLEFHFGVPVNFDGDYTGLLVSIAQHCAQALDRARLYESAQTARAEAEAANRLKDDFLSILSHELRTPLNAVVGWAWMLRRQDMKPETAARAVQSIYDNAMRQTKLIDDLLDVSRMAARPATLDLQEVDLRVLIAGVVESVTPAAASQQVELSVTPIPPTVVRGDRRRLEQVFFNLLGNALKFTPEGGHITIDALQIDGTVRVRVRDDGIGIEPEFLPHVFERFRQGDSSPTRNYGGLGLGLSIVKQLVEAHDGEVTVESAGPGQGATFSIILPAVSEPSDAEVRANRAGSQPRMAEIPRLDGVRVLVVDDEPDACSIMAHALEASGADVTVASGAADALGKLQVTDIDVLLADIAMPETNGYALIRSVRALPDHRVASIPAVAVTAHARQCEQEEAFTAGFQSHLAKPLDPGELVRTVRNLL